MVEVLAIGGDDLVAVAVLAEPEGIRPVRLLPATAHLPADIDEAVIGLRPFDELAVGTALADIGDDALAGQRSLRAARVGILPSPSSSTRSTCSHV